MKQSTDIFMTFDWESLSDRAGNQAENETIFFDRFWQPRGFIYDHIIKKRRETKPGFDVILYRSKQKSQLIFVIVHKTKEMYGNNNRKQSAV